MQPTCAICMLPLTRQQRFVLIGTEAAHRECAVTGKQTVLAKMEKFVADVRVEVAQIGRKAGDLERGTQRDRDENRDLTRRLSEARSMRATLSDMLLDAQQQRREAQAECERLRARIAQLEAPPAAVSTEVEDEAEVRFGLLELD